MIGLEAVKATMLAPDKPFKTWIRKFLLVLVFATSVGVIMPFRPTMPVYVNAEGFATNYLVGQEHAFGKDYIFTYGPYVSVYLCNYHPATYNLMMAGCGLVALAFFGCSVELFCKRSVLLTILVVVILNIFLLNRDALLLSYPFLAGLTIIKRCQNKAESGLDAWLNWMYISLYLSPFALLPLVKGSILIECCAVLIILAVYLVYKRFYVKVVFCLLYPSVLMVLLWIMAGQKSLNLIDYFESIIPVISGYSAAMSLRGEFNEILAFLCGALILIFLSVAEDLQMHSGRKHSKSEKIFAVSLLLVYLFISFKAGFVRHDAHVLSAVGSLAVAMVSVLAFYDIQRFKILCVAVIFVTFYLNSHYIKPFGKVAYTYFHHTYIDQYNSAVDRLLKPDQLEHAYNDAIASLKNNVKLPKFSGTVDIYSYDQAYLIASGNEYAPRPIIQSYCVYTPQLAESNKIHLLGKDAPENILFKIQPIDHRLPSTEDGNSWIALLDRYNYVENNIGYVVLKRKNHYQPSVMEKMLCESEYNFGDVIKIPKNSSMIFANIFFNMSWLGKIENLLYKPSEISIFLTLSSGKKVEYRIIPGMTETDFMINPLVINTPDFLALFKNDATHFSKTVESFTINSRGRFNGWNKKIKVRFKEISLNNGGV